MFDPEEIPELKKVIHACALMDRKLLEELCAQVRPLKNLIRTIKPRTTTSISLVASDGGNNKLVYDPFYFQLIKVVDSNGSRGCLDVISPTTDTDLLGLRQFDQEGKPITALGVLMHDLSCKTLHDLSPMIPTGEQIRSFPESVRSSWVLDYRDLCEWAVLYKKICYSNFSSHTLIVRDGLLRSKIIKKDRFVIFRQKIDQAIENIYKRDRVKVFLVGLAKHSSVLTRYSLAMAIENVLYLAEPLYLKVPQEIELKTYKWAEWVKNVDEDGEGFSLGQMYLARFGKLSGDPVWAIDIYFKQLEKEAEIFSYLLADAMEGFPVPYYPLCLQRAHEQAQVTKFDIEILQDEVIRAIKAITPEERKHIVDEQVFNSDKSLNRY